MRVLFVAYSPKYTLSLPQGFKELGYPVHILREMNRHSIGEAIDIFKPELILTTGWAYRRHNKRYLKEFVERVTNAKIPHIYWATEDPRWTEKCSLRCIKVFKPNGVLTINPGSINVYTSMGIPAGHLDFGCNPEFNKTIPRCNEYSYDVAIVGNGGKEWRSFRKNSVQLLLRPLIESGFEIAIWGKRWDRFDEAFMEFKIPRHMIKGELPYEETNKVYNSAKIIIGLQNDQDMLTSRTFEVLGSGGFLLTPVTRAIDKLFMNNVHLMCSSSPEDTVNLANYFLKDEMARREVSINGQREVYSKHTYRERALQIVNFAVKNL